MELADFAKIVKADLRNDYAVPIAVTGNMGEGKSTFVYQAGKLIDPRFTIQRNFIFEPFYNQIRERMLGLEVESSPIIDEAIKTLFRQDWYSELQKSLYKLFTVIRIKRQATFICIPYFNRLRTDFRNDIVKYWVHIPKRGVAILFTKLISPFEQDPWNMKENMAIFREASKHDQYFELETDINKQVNYYKKTPSYVSYMLFEKMPKDEEKLYLELSNPSKFKLTDEKQPVMETHKAKEYRRVAQRLLWLIRENVPWSQQKIAQQVGLDPATVSVWLKSYEAEKQKEVDKNAVPITQT